jgi:hypothetical protein
VVVMNQSDARGCLIPWSGLEQKGSETDRTSKRYTDNSGFDCLIPRVQVENKAKAHLVIRVGLEILFVKSA